MRTAGQKALQANTEPAAQRTLRPDTQNGTPIIHRRPEHPAPAQGPAGEDSGEAVLKAQTVSPAQAASLNAAYSYPPGSGTGRDPARPAAELTREQEERITQRVLEDINYNRMASEVLERVERRLRAERRKFGR